MKNGIGQITEIPEITGEKCYFWDYIYIDDTIQIDGVEKSISEVGTYIPDLYLENVYEHIGGELAYVVKYQFRNNGKCYEVRVCISEWKEFDTTIMEMREQTNSWYEVFEALSL